MSNLVLPKGKERILSVTSKEEDSWRSRGYLPHRNDKGILQSITFRLGDSLPKDTLNTLLKEVEKLPTSLHNIEKRKRIEELLDSGIGCCALRNKEVSNYVKDALHYFHGTRYDLHAWVIMPNHVHALIETNEDLGIIVGGWKSFTSRWILKNNELLKLKIPTPNQLWQREYWDRYIRNEKHYNKTVDYIHKNPVAARLCKEACDWEFSSAS